MEQTRWAWQDRIPLGGVTLLAGQEGSGKTTILANVLARATRGQLPGDLIGDPVGCVYATAEDSHSRTLAPRMAAAGADLDRIFFVEVDGLAGGLSILEICSD
jgi:KaiC/GvpD/RAD55 family RecA-like ATPase